MSKRKTTEPEKDSNSWDTNQPAVNNQSVTHQDAPVPSSPIVRVPAPGAQETSQDFHAASVIPGHAPNELSPESLAAFFSDPRMTALMSQTTDPPLQETPTAPPKQKKRRLVRTTFPENSVHKVLTQQHRMTSNHETPVSTPHTVTHEAPVHQIATSMTPGVPSTPATPGDLTQGIDSPGIDQETLSAALRIYQILAKSSQQALTSMASGVNPPGQDLQAMINACFTPSFGSPPVHQIQFSQVADGTTPSTFLHQKTSPISMGQGDSSSGLLNASNPLLSAMFSQNAVQGPHHVQQTPTRPHASAQLPPSAAVYHQVHEQHPQAPHAHHQMDPILYKALQENIALEQRIAQLERENKSQRSLIRASSIGIRKDAEAAEMNSAYAATAKRMDNTVEKCQLMINALHELFAGLPWTLVLNLLQAARELKSSEGPVHFTVSRSVKCQGDASESGGAVDQPVAEEREQEEEEVEEEEEEEIDWNQPSTSTGKR